MTKLGCLAGRGALIGFTHLFVYHKALNFLEQDMDPFGTKAVNVDKQIKDFVKNERTEEMEHNDGSMLLNKLLMIGYFD